MESQRGNVLGTPPRGGRPRPSDSQRARDFRRDTAARRRVLEEQAISQQEEQPDEGEFSPTQFIEGQGNEDEDRSQPAKRSQPSQSFRQQDFGEQPETTQAEEPSAQPGEPAGVQPQPGQPEGQGFLDRARKLRESVRAARGARAAQSTEQTAVGLARTAGAIARTGAAIARTGAVVVQAAGAVIAFIAATWYIWVVVLIILVVVIFIMGIACGQTANPSDTSLFALQTALRTQLLLGTGTNCFGN